MSNLLWPHGLQHSRLPFPLPTPRAYSNSCALSRWCHPTISSCVLPFSSCLQSFPASGKEPACQFRRHKRRRFDPWVGKIPWRRKWQPTPVFMPGKSHGLRSLVGYSPWGRKESDTTEQLHFSLSLSDIFTVYKNNSIFTDYTTLKIITRWWL